MKEKLIYIYPKKATFIERDLLFLRNKYNVVTQDLDWGNAKKLPLNFLRQFLFFLFNISNTKAIVINFGGYFSYLPTIFGKLLGIKTFVILNGTDCVSFPKYNYGSLRKKALKKCIYKSLKNATKLLPVDVSLVRQNYIYDENVTHKIQGFQYFFPDLNTPFQVIPNGFDTNFWHYNLMDTKKGFISVGFVNSYKTFYLKGFDLVIESAKNYPNQIFTLVGLSNEFKKELPSMPQNVKTIPYLTESALKKEYQKHQFYLQISLNEGFGCALAEAMLCGCLPIVSNVGALPNVIKDSGFIVSKKGSYYLNSEINKILDIKKEDLQKCSEKARQNISDNFDISIREDLLLQEIET